MALSLCSVLAVAGLARADGEDDPTYGSAGTVWLPFEDASMQTPPVVDQAADGTIVTAAGAHRNLTTREAPVVDGMRVVRTNAAGATLSDETYASPLPLGPAPGVTFDVEAMPGNAVTVAYEGEVPPPTEEPPERIAAPQSEHLLVVLAIAGDGADAEWFSAPDLCFGEVGSRAQITPYPAAAEVAGDGTVYAVWNDCAGEEPVLATYVDDEEVDAGEVGAEGSARDLVLGPDGDLFVASWGTYEEDPPVEDQRANFEFGSTLVTRHDLDTLNRDEDYGNDDAPGAIIPGRPIDLTADPSGRVTVWAKEAVSGRGAGDPWLLYRLDPAGDLDGAWGTNGVATLTNALFREPYLNGGEEAGHLIAQTDGKVVIVGPTQATSDRRGEALPEFVVARTTAGGVLDPSWDGDGVRAFDIDPAAKDDAELFTVGEPGLQRDGKLLVPSGGYTSSDSPRRVPAPPQDRGPAIGLSRIGLTPATPPGETQQPAPAGPASPPAAPAPVTAASSQAARTCKSRRSLTIRLRTGRTKKEQSAIRSAVVRVNGRRVKVSKGARQTSRVVLTNLPKGRYAVDIRLVLEDGGKVRDVRRYRTCAQKIERELAPLRTHPPR